MVKSHCLPRLRPQFIMGNWKMNGSQAFHRALLAQMKSLQPSKNQHIVIFPPFVYLEKTAQTLKYSLLSWGGQNVSAYAQGPYTGEISASMLKDLGCQYALIGHSERRQYFNETDEMIAEKFLASVRSGLRPVLCLGETLDEYRLKKTQQKILTQLKSVLEFGFKKSGLDLLIIAYEPVWAIGTGLTAEPSYVQGIHEFIRTVIAEKDKNLADLIPILYGGSVKADNAKQLFSMPDVDGGLIGGASLVAEEFQAICQANNEE